MNIELVYTSAVRLLIRKTNNGDPVRGESQMETWRPDWHDESAYDSLKNASWGKWAWEFLRRNDEYQGDWDKVVADCHHNGIPVALTPLSRKLAQNWGLSEMVDPSVDGAEGRWLMSRFAKLLTKSRKSPNIEYLDLKNKKFRGYGFDLTWPIGPQVEAVKQDLQALQNSLLEEGKIKLRKSPPKTGDLRLYLRILDARAKKISKKEIVTKLEPYVSIGADGSDKDMDRLDENLKAARRLVTGNYSKLLLRLPEV